MNNKFINKNINKAESYNYKIDKEAIIEIAKKNDIDEDDLMDSYLETGDILVAQLMEEQKKVLGKESLNTLTMNGNIYPDDVYDFISEAAAERISFKYDKYILTTLIKNSRDDDLLALQPLDIILLVVNVDSKDKDFYTDDDIELINELYENSLDNQVVTGKDAKTILKFLSARRLPVKDNTKLYNKYIEKRKYEFKANNLENQNEKLLDSSSDIDLYKEYLKYINKNYLENDNENVKTRKKTL